MNSMSENAVTAEEKSMNAGRRTAKNKSMTVFVFMLTLLAAAARFPAVHFFSDPYTGFYERNAAGGFLDYLPGLADYAISAIIAVLFLTQFVLYRQKRSEPPSGEAFDRFVQGTQPLAFTSVLVGFMMLSNAVIYVYDYLNKAWDSQTGFSRVFSDASSYFNGFTVRSLGVLLGFALGAMCIPAGIYFIKTAFIKPAGKEGGEPPVHGSRIAMSFTPFLWMIGRVFNCFFNMSSAVNAPGRMYELVCMLAMMLYFVSETRLLSGDLRSARFFTYAYISLIMIAASSSVNLVLNSFTYYNAVSFLQIVYATDVAVFAYIITRLYAQHGYAGYRE